MTDEEIEALRKCVANALRGDSLGATEEDRMTVTNLSIDALSKLRAASREGGSSPDDDAKFLAEMCDWIPQDGKLPISEVQEQRIRAIARRLGASRERAAALPPTEVRQIVDEQADDDGLWFEATTAPEAYLQQALRRLSSAVERATGGETGPLAEALPATAPIPVTFHPPVEVPRHHPDCVAVSCDGRCGRVGPCYVDMARWRGAARG